jgi:hypothetical protein
LSDEIPQVKRTMTEELADFVQKHGIEWLIRGDLKCLRQMMLTSWPASFPHVRGGFEAGVRRAIARAAPDRSARGGPAPGGEEMKRRRRSVGKRNRQRLAAHARRLKR